MELFYFVTTFKGAIELPTQNAFYTIYVYVDQDLRILFVVIKQQRNQK
jgi:hypothetical protein